MDSHWSKCKETIDFAQGSLFLHRVHHPTTFLFPRAQEGKEPRASGHLDSLLQAILMLPSAVL